MSSTDPLAAELEVFDARRAEWLESHPGEFVVIQDNTVLPEFFGSYADAFKAGLKRFGASRSFLDFGRTKLGMVSKDEAPGPRRPANCVQLRCDSLLAF